MTQYILAADDGTGDTCIVLFDDETDPGEEFQSSVTWHALSVEQVRALRDSCDEALSKPCGCVGDCDRTQPDCEEE